MKQTLGLWRTTSLVIGNMIGAGIFLLPASLANFGSISILAWIITSCGAICLSLIFARLGQRYQETGGPYIYSKKVLGNFIGFQVAWNYWIANGITGNAALTVAFVSYMTYFIPQIAENYFASLFLGLGVLWIITFINIFGVKVGSTLQLITTILKIIPLIIIIIIGIFYINIDHILPFTYNNSTNFKQSLISAISLTLFAFIGLEASTILSENVKNSKKTVPLATIIGTIFTALIYIIITIILMGIIPPEDLAQSKAPFADAADYIFETKWIGSILAISAILSSFGTLSGWILLQGQIPYAMARDNLFPKIFIHLSKSDVPVVGLIISSILTSLLLIIYNDSSLIKQFTFIGKLTIFSTLIPYISTILSNLVLVISERKSLTLVQFIKDISISLLAFVYTICAIIGFGKDIILTWLIFTLISLPLYVWVQSNKKK